MAAVEVLASWNGICDAVVGMSDGAEDQVVLVHQLGAAKREMLAGAGVEDDEASIGVCCAGNVYGARLLRAWDGEWAGQIWRPMAPPRQYVWHAP